MYLVSFYEKEGVVEASLGGRVTADEIAVFGEELLELVEDLDSRPFVLFLDHSKAKRFDGEALVALGQVKDRCLAAGATEIVCAPTDEEDLAIHQTARIQQVLEGTERFVFDLSQVKHTRAFVVERKAA